MVWKGEEKGKPNQKYFLRDSRKPWGSCKLLKILRPSTFVGGGGSQPLKHLDSFAANFFREYSLGKEDF